MPTFFQRIQTAIKAFNQNTDPRYNQFIYNYIGNKKITNTENDDNYITKGYQKNPTIYSIINLITKCAVSIPYMVYKKENGEAFKKYKSLTTGTINDDSIIQSKILKKDAFTLVEGTELEKLLERPNPAQSYATFMTELIAFGKLTGNRYVYGIGPETRENAKFNELYVLPSHLIEIKSGGMFEPVSKYCMSYNTTSFDIDAEDVLHIADFNPDYDGSGSHLYGQSPLLSGLRTMTTNNEAVETSLKYLQNQTARGILTSDDESLTPTQAQQLKDAFRRNYQGSYNAGDIIITPKKLSWTNFGLSAGDLQLMESYNATIKDICNIYSTPVQLLNNTESSTYNNMKEAKKAFYINAVIPELVKVRDELNRWLTPQYGEDLYIDFDFSTIPELQQEQEKLVDQLTKSYWLSLNEKRQAMGYSTSEDSVLDDIFIPANLIPIDDFDLGSDTKNFFESGFEEKEEIKPALKKALQRKADEHNEKVGNAKTKRTNVRTLFAVYKRGVGAYRTNPSSVRPSVNSEQQWAMARVNSFLYVLRNGKFRSGQHDTDLLPEGHPKSSKKNDDVIIDIKQELSEEVYSSPDEAMDRAREIGCSTTHSHIQDGSTVYMPCESMSELERALENEDATKQETYGGYPKKAIANAERAVKVNEKYNNKCATNVGKQRAKDIIANRSFSLSVLKRVYSYLSRAKEYDTGVYEKDDKPICGTISYNLWGGDAMKNWAESQLNKLDE